MVPTIPQLTAILHLTDSGSFTEAASLLGVSQPTLSRTVRAAEDALGARLFDRDTRRIGLTPFGVQFLPIARRLVHEWQGATEEVDQVVRGERGRLTVAALPSVAATLLPPTLARFRASYPGVDVHIHDGLSEPVLAMVEDGRADIGITVRPLPHRRLHYKALLSDRFCLVQRSPSRCRARPATQWSTFAGEPFIALSPASSVRMMTDAAFLQAGVAPTHLFECAQLATVGGLVAAGLGITALPQLAFELLAGYGLVVRPLVNPVLDRSIGTVARAGRHSPPAVGAFLAALATEAEHFTSRNRRLAVAGGQADDKS